MSHNCWTKLTQRHEMRLKNSLCSVLAVFDSSSDDLCHKLIKALCKFHATNLYQVWHIGVVYDPLSICQIWHKSGRNWLINSTKDIFPFWEIGKKLKIIHSLKVKFTKQHLQLCRPCVSPSWLLKLRSKFNAYDIIDVINTWKNCTFEPVSYKLDIWSDLCLTVCLVSLFFIKNIYSLKGKVKVKGEVKSR
jgi:hypothetical protein